MKPVCFRLGILALAAIQTATASAVIFTSDTTIASGDATYDGQDLVISNCVLTVDGPHNFASVRVAGTGSLTHSFDPSGILSIFVSVTNESHVLIGTTPTSLGNSNVVLTSVVVADSTGTVTYTNGVDYTLTGNADGSASLQRTSDSTIPDGSQVSVSYNFFSGSTSAGLNLVVAGDVVVEAGSMINAAGRGY